jgi:hypothetical protein
MTNSELMLCAVADDEPLSIRRIVVEDHTSPSLSPNRPLTELQINESDGPQQYSSFA